MNLPPGRIIPDHADSKTIVQTWDNSLAARLERIERASLSGGTNNGANFLVGIQRDLMLLDRARTEIKNAAQAAEAAKPSGPAAE